MCVGVSVDESLKVVGFSIEFSTGELSLSKRRKRWVVHLCPGKKIHHSYNTNQRLYALKVWLV